MIPKTHTSTPLKLSILKSLLILVLMVSIHISICQNSDRRSNIKHYLAEIATTSTSPDRVDLMTDLSWEFLFVNLDSAKLFAEQAQELAVALAYVKGEASAMSRLGTVQELNGNYQQALALQKQTLEKRRQLGNLTAIGNTYSNIGTIQNHLRRYDEAIHSFDSALQFYARAGDQQEIPGVYNNLSHVHLTLGNYEEAISFGMRSLEARKAMRDSLGMAKSLLNLGLAYYQFGYYEKALNNFVTALQVFENRKEQRFIGKILLNIGNVYFAKGDYSLAAEHYLSSMDIKLLSKSQEGLDHLYNNLGVIYENQGRYGLAEDYYKESLSLRQASDDSLGLATTFHNMGILASKQRAHRRALAYFQKALDHLSVGSRFIKSEIYYAMTYSWDQLGEHEEALKSFRKYNVQKDSLLGQERLAMNLQHELAMVTKDNELKEAALAKKVADAERKSMIIYALIIGTVLLLFTLLSLYRAKQQKQQKIMAEDRVNHLMQQQESKTLEILMENQQAVSKRIGQDLHDRINGHLSIAKKFFENFTENEKQFSPVYLEKFNKANQILGDAIDHIREISHEMESGGAGQFLLVNVVEDLAETINANTRLETIVDVHGNEDQFDYKQKANIYLIISEAISNILKHAQATECSIAMNFFDEELNLIIEDKGMGFEMGTRMESNGIGLSSMEDRVNRLNGGLELDSAPGRGTIINIHIPYI